MELEEKRPLYRQQIIQTIPDLAIQSWRENHEGMVNDVVIINETLIFRFPKNDSWAVEDLHAEANILSFLRPRLEMPLPESTIYDGKLIGHSFMGQVMIPGQPLQQHDIYSLASRPQAALAEQLGTFLSQLHLMPVDKAKAAGITPSFTNRTGAQWLQLYEDVQRELFPHLMDFQKEWVHHHFTPLVDDPTWMESDWVMMNGDLASYHLLYNRDTGKLNGIIDFGTAGLGDPACDFACLLNQYGEPFVNQIGRTYGNTASLMERAKFWAGTLWLQWALGGLRNPDDPSWFFVHIGRANGTLPT